ncbi:T9SS type A sorting domain-containing protein, partial [Bacteroidota bacterium]
VLLMVMLVYSTGLQAQKYKQMMDDQSINIYDVEKEAEKYFSIHGTGKRSGWKQFQRWFYEMELNFGPVGDRSSYNLSAGIAEYKKYSKKHTSQTKSAWSELGPYSAANRIGSWSPGLGRIDAVWMDPYNINRLYLGSRSGGFWKSTNGGLNWSCMTDNLAVIGVNTFAVDPNNFNVIYINHKVSANNRSLGILKSTDGGINWNSTGFIWTTNDNVSVYKIIAHPVNSNILYVTASNGIYKTTNGGSTWGQIQTGDWEDFEFKPGNPTIIYAVKDSDDDIYKSIDSGTTFTKIETPTKKPEIDVTAADSSYLYYANSDGVWRSTNSGVTFTNMGNAPTSKMSFGVSDTDKDRVLFGGLDTYLSTNGGSSFSQCTWWSGRDEGDPDYIHADLREVICVNGTFVIGTDGYMCKSTNGGTVWQTLSVGVSTHEIYRIGVSQLTPDNVLTGSQDNGTMLYKNNDWYSWLGADGMECAFDLDNPYTYIGTSQNGTIYKTTTGSGRSTITPRDTANEREKGAWITPFIIDPNSSNTIIAGYDRVYKTTDNGTNWTAISNHGEFGGNLALLAIAESNSNIIYAARSNKIWKTNNGGNSWTQLNNPWSPSISYISAHPTDTNKVVVALSGFTAGEKIYESNDGGSTWTNISGALPNLPSRCAIYEDSLLNRIFLGTELGVYYKDDTTSNWVSFMTNLPMVTIRELEIQKQTKKLFAGSWGRGVWSIQLPNPTGIGNELVNEHSINVYPNPSKGTFNIKTSGLGHYDYTVREMSGRLILQGQFDDNNKTRENTIYIGNHTGIYILSIKNKSKIEVEKIIVL